MNSTKSLNNNKLEYMLVKFIKEIISDKSIIKLLKKDKKFLELFITDDDSEYEIDDEDESDEEESDEEDEEESDEDDEEESDQDDEEEDDVSDEEENKKWCSFNKKCCKKKSKSKKIVRNLMDTYILFCKENREKIKKQYPKLSYKQIQKKLGKEWGKIKLSKLK